MLPQTPPEPEQNSTRVNLLISLVFHVTVLLALTFFAAREGLLGKQLKKIAVEMVKETPPEKPKEPKSRLWSRRNRNRPESPKLRKLRHPGPSHQGKPGRLRRLPS